MSNHSINNGNLSKLWLPVAKELADLGTISCKLCGAKLISGGLVLVEIRGIPPGQTVSLGIWQLVHLVIGQHIGDKHPQEAIEDHADVQAGIETLAFVLAAGRVDVTGAKPEVDLEGLAATAQERLIARIGLLAKRISQHTTDPADPAPKGVSS